ncbi:MAG TPA: rhomboid family intramembrane serine protease [Terracidiphilus sp.]|nr:rhomboid family intramembrane serine protease [Terracidiphilus sp.]
MGSSPHSVPEPEILPPGVQYAPPQERRRPKPAWIAAPATHLLVAINCLVFLAMVANHVSAFDPTPQQLFAWHANNAGAVLLYGQWSRIIVAMFVHVGILHLATNMWCLWNLGLLAEPLMGSAGVFAVYLLTGAAGNLLSTLWNWLHPIHEGNAVVFPVGAGASGAVFGIAGALIVLLKSTRLPVPAYELKRLRRSVIYFAGINLVLGLSITGGTHLFGAGVLIDNSAHVGGFLCGLLFAMPMVPRLGSPRPVFRARLGAAMAMVTAVLVLFVVFLTHLAG